MFFDCLLRNSICSPLLSLLVWLEKDVCMNPLSMNLASVLVYVYAEFFVLAVVRHDWHVFLILSGLLFGLGVEQ